MKICIFGAGAIGGYVAAELALSGQDVTVIARGPHLAAIRERGLTLQIGGQTKVARVAATADPAEAGPQDSVIVTLKAHSLPPVAHQLTPLFGPETSVVTAMNGVPWWYFERQPGPFAGHRIVSVDPEGKLAAAIAPERVIGCVVYPACEVVEPGVVRHVEGNRFQLGEIDGQRTPRIEALSQAMNAAGLKAPIRPRIRDDIWLKLWGNAGFNPISALTHGTLEEIAGDAATRPTVRLLMVEVEAVARALGAKLAVDVDTRIQWARDVGAHKTSMLQDLERGRPMEIDALVTAVQELARLVGVATPTLDVVLGLVQQRAQTASRAAH
ncbi:ketopantoate reductase [Stella humosa]|uniref:2-dehydropantoate 2-reductase n=1 Tax=Stella humosa TaxID=94 RepID=A0A3N1LIJ6_9PROT|nr:2-dehydropantoate 2-reductase [Stella humosa]ROP91357.1 ketopantoate reductase [Stella humosa]BBK34283.1 2-dehydropantoate 2-reductase [Stella humosa]